MEGPSHMRIGAAVGAAAGWSMGAPANLALALHPFHLPPFVEGVLAGGGAALVCGAIGAVAGLLPDLDSESTLGAGLPRWWHSLTPGHRGLTHSLLGLALWWGAAWMASAVLGTTTALLMALVVVGVVSHLAADMLTSHGIRPLYPFSSWHLRSVLPFRTGAWPEKYAVAAVVLLSLAWIAEPSLLAAVVHGARGVVR